MTALEAKMAILLFVGLFVVGVAGVMLTYKLMELRWGIGSILGILSGLGILAGIYTVGDPLWEPSYAAYEQGVFVGLAGLICGLGVMITLFEPDSESEAEESEGDSPYRPASMSDSSSTGTDIPGGMEDLED
jgi:hypothetical protein